MTTQRKISGSPTLRKSIEQIHTENASHGLTRSLNAVQLTMLGVGSTIGAGIYVMTGTAAANYAGPSILLSFLVAGLACLFTALSYSELASAMPVSGSSYSYAYVSLGERWAWWTGWLLLLEYGISCAGVAAGFSGYAVSLLHDFGIIIPDALTHTTIHSTLTPSGMVADTGWRLDAVGAGVILFVTFFLVRGIQESARINTAVVFLKVGVLLIFVLVGIRAIHPEYWHPFIPPSEGAFRYGIGGIFRAASLVFFAYVGFEAVSTASAEAINPRKDVPTGIVLSLVICTLVYICVAAVLIGVVPWRTLDVADPLALAVDAMGMPSLTIIVKLGAVIGLCSVLFGLLYAQSRIFFTISRDGLIPQIFSQLHPRFNTPWLGAILLGLFVALATATLPIDIIGDLVSIGTASAFGVVSFTVIWDRNTRPDGERPFKVPLGGVTIGGVWIGIVPALGILFSVIMAAPLFIDVLRDFTTGNRTPLILLVLYFTTGALIYRFYGRQNSRLAASNPMIGK
ncbi:MAG: amino acid permease [Acetobacter sp.]|jgi:APA family basic amino acid/polyamine antiporter|nr:amino acid permease [Acetobacter sp.]MCH4061046.1 amino acid permease [Acetobacter sp.]MCH4087985.1 amino acid permease [Acetobacter sp.]MCI1293402.1 amino acid permease [Acetobacter sp.]MCI1319973.1 amino acid permease [Acetobacter sp.]